MAKFTKVTGKNIGEIKVYALSTCGWCKKTKNLLSSNKIEYYYLDVDKLEGDEVDIAKAEIRVYNKSCSFPTVIINNKDCIIGYDEEKLNALIGVL